MIQSYPWYISDWRQDENVLKMTAEQQGIYRNLLDMCWDQGSLPTDEDTLIKYALCTQKEWARSWPVVSLQFEQADNRLRNSKIDKKRPEILQAAASRTKSASKAAALRWESKRNARGNAVAIRDASVTQCVGNTSECGTSSSSSSSLTTPTVPDELVGVPDLSDFAAELRALFPGNRQGSIHMVEQAVAAQFGPYGGEQLEAQKSRARRSLARYLASEEVQRGVCCNAHRWISEGRWQSSESGETAAPKSMYPVAPTFRPKGDK